MEQDLNKLLHKYKQGNTTLDEEFILSDRLSDPTDEFANSLLTEGFDHSMEASAKNDRNLGILLDKIHHTIRLRETTEKQAPRLRFMGYASRVAAVLFLPLLLVTSYMLFEKDGVESQLTKLELVAPAGSRLNFELPDGTIGTLAGNSKLEYNSAFASNRDLKLSGQAYFDVAHDKKHPFKVEAKGSTIEVVGTKFSLSAYPDDILTDLILEEGKVNYISGTSKKKFMMKPGDRLIEKSGVIKKITVDTWKYTAWKDGKLVFRSESMQDLGKRISRWYNVDVEINSPSMNEYRFRGVFEDDSLDDVLALLKMTSPFSYRIQERKLNSDGSFTKKKVIFY